MEGYNICENIFYSYFTHMKNTKIKKNFWWMVGYILTWLVFFSWVAIFVRWLNASDSSIGDLSMMYLWLWIKLIFRLKWETREKWIRILKKIWKWIWIFLLICLILLIIDIIYGKIQYSKVPEVDESMFQRSEHQAPLPDDEDALIQLKN